ncbi:MAG: MFS transporter [Prevotella sp.]|nr:MFS transporter [Prevotella sp.]
MFENQPKGLFTLALANTGERFGYYTMLAIFTLFLQAKFGYTASQTSTIFASFLACVYFMPVVGGILADRFGYGKMVTLGICVMFVGYVLLSIPFEGAAPMFAALFAISLGTGLFKGNLQVMVGNLYDNPKYANRRDVAFSLFYMAINIGALFAPTAANKVAGYFLGKSGLTYDPDIPSLANALVRDYDHVTLKQVSSLTQLAEKQNVDAASLQGLHDFCDKYMSVPELANAPVSKLGEYLGNVDMAAMLQPLNDFSSDYLTNLAGAYHWGFAVACVSLIVSMLIYVLGRSTFKGAEASQKSAKADEQAAPVEELSKSETNQRIVALVLVFLVVLFFWMSFHQNGLTLTFFARDYTAKTISGIGTIVFNVLNLAMIIVAFYSLFNIFQSKTTKAKVISALIIALCMGGVCALYVSSGSGQEMKVGPELYQQFNPFFVVLLTPVSLAVFGWLAKHGKEPSAPRKIGLGMIIAAVGFLVMAIGSFGLPKPEVTANLSTDGWTAAQWSGFFGQYVPLATTGGAVAVADSFSRVSPAWLISTYLILTFAELLLSPMGISFVSKVAPPKYKGLMMGGWFAATAVGNYMVAIIGYLWGAVELWMLWCILIVLCLLASLFIFSIMKRLEKVC